MRNLKKLILDVHQSVMIQIVTFFLFCIPLITSLPNIVYADQYGEYLYSVNDGYITIESYLGEDQYVKIPETINGYIVDVISDNAFANMPFISSPVRVPYGVLVEDDAFQGSDCGWVYYGETEDGFLFEMGNEITITGYTGDTAFSLPQKIDGYPITIIGDQAFKGRDDLQGELNIPGTVKSIGESAFKDCSNLTGNFDFVSQLSVIGDYAFSGCSGLEGAISVKAENWGTHSFEGCTGLTAFSTENGIIPDYTFAGCTNLFMGTNYLMNLNDLMNIVLVRHNEYGDYIEEYHATLSIGAHAFEETNITDIEYEGWEPLYDMSPMEPETRYFLDIGDYAFANSAVSQVDITGNDYKIGGYVFSGCHIENATLSVVNSNTCAETEFDHLTCWNEGLTIPADAFKMSNIAELVITVHENSDIHQLWAYHIQYRGGTLEIKENAFRGSIIGSLSMDSECCTIEGGAFQNGSIQSLAFTVCEMTIPAYSFSSQSFSSIKINSYTNKIDDYYYNEEIVFSSNLTIEVGAFQDCTVVDAITISVDNPVHLNLNFLFFLTLFKSVIIQDRYHH